MELLTEYLPLNLAGEHVGFGAGRESDPQLWGLLAVTLGSCLDTLTLVCSLVNECPSLAGMKWVTRVRCVSPGPAYAKQFGRRSILYLRC